jgi:hypothetical protein
VNKGARVQVQGKGRQNALSWQVLGDDPCSMLLQVEHYSMFYSPHLSDVCKAFGAL